MGLRRLPETILAAHEMDRQRRELYVEGIQDRVFFNWLMRGEPNHDALVVCIDDVELPDPHLHPEDDSYGNRDRVIEFMRLVAGSVPSIRGFVDRDQDHLLGINVLPDGTSVTDFRDLESYVLFEENIDQVLRAGAGVDAVSASDFLESLLRSSKVLAAIRLVSTRENYRLPVGSTKWERHIRARSGLVSSFDEQAVIRQLLQNARLGISLVSSVVAEVRDALVEIDGLQPQMCVQGKDAMRIARLQLASLNIDIGDAYHLLGSTFRVESVPTFPELASVMNYLRRAS